MRDETPAQLKIVTTLQKAIDIYPLTLLENARPRNRFLEYFRIKFREPEPHKTEFIRSAYAPMEGWFALFDEAEKEIMEDDMAFYGVMYQTTPKLAVKRLKLLIEKIEESHRVKTALKAKEENRRFHYRLQELQDAHDALDKFNSTDEVTMTFLFAEWPDVDVARKTDYIKKFEEKILGQKREDDDFPF